MECMRGKKQIQELEDGSGIGKLHDFIQVAA
jgi:hypothetical protein